MQEPEAVQQIPETVAQVLNVLGEKFGATGAHLWEVMVRQQVIESVSSMIGFMVAAAAIVGFVMLAKFSYARADWTSYNDDAYKVMTVVSSVAAAIMLIVTLVIFFLDIGSVVMGFVNPEYGALKEVLRTIGG